MIIIENITVSLYQKINKNMSNTQHSLYESEGRGAYYLIPILCKDFNSYTMGWKCMSSDIGVMLSDHLPDQV